MVGKWFLGQEVYSAPIGVQSTFQEPEEAGAAVDSSVLLHFMVQTHWGFSPLFGEQGEVPHPASLTLFSLCQTNGSRK